MNLLLRKILTSRSKEYLNLDENLIILEASTGVGRFADLPGEVKTGHDVRLSFPELIGVEEVLRAVLRRERDSFELNGIGRFRHDNQPLYFDLYITEGINQESLASCLIVLIEDVTELMVAKQALVQRASEAELLLSALKSSQDYLQKTISSMADILIATTASGAIKNINLAAEKILGYGRSELVNRAISLIIPNEASLRNFNCTQESSSQLLEIVCHTKSGQTITIEFCRSTVQTEFKDIQDFVYIGRDITERKQVEAEMQKALQQERELNELKSHFISVASHEFRNPLSSIQISADLLEAYGSSFTEKEKLRHFHHIQDAVQQMVTLLDDVLILGKVDAEKEEFNPIAVDLEGLCRCFVEDMQMIDENQHQISFICQGSCTEDCVDPKLLRHIFANLLSNALKYSPFNSTIYFLLTLREAEAIFEIQDQGIGIPAEDQPRLFETFHRARNVNDLPGTGLGLSIVKKYVDLHGGTISFYSRIGLGTTFQVTLPLSH